tara:strand:+ start:90 stop:3440 length:3351 start_codon:yes stop_codon:yes gene_type:complete
MADWSEKLKQNSGMNFVQRAINPNIFPRINNADGSVSTHLMAAEVDENGDWYAFPTIIQDGSGELIKMSNPEAFDYAKRSGENIPFGKDGDGAIDFSINYKSPSMLGKPQPKTDGTVVNVKGLGLMRVAQQSQPQATAGINARVDKQRAWDAKVQGGMDWVGGQIADVALDEYGELNDPAKLKAALDNKYQEVRGFTDMITQGLTPTQKAAFLTMGVNGLGDITGLAADAEMYITDPESRTWFNAAMSGAGVAGGAVSISPSMAAILPIIRKNIDAWHGSPHKFDNFSMSNINTGEGAQAYGHGLYFAEGKGTGEAYLNNLGGIEISVGDKVYDTVDFKDPRNKMAGRIRSQMPGNNAGWATSGTRPSLDEAIAAVKESASPEDIKILDEMIADGLEARNTGSLYNVNLKVDPDDLLDWDAPFHRQPKNVQEFMSGLPGGDDWNDSYGMPLTGPGLYEKIKNRTNGLANESAIAGAGIDRSAGFAGGADEITSRYMAAQGVPGIKYLDEVSRSAGEGTRNFVIFDDSLVDIKTRNGEALNPVQRQAAVGEMMGGGVKPNMPEIIPTKDSVQSVLDSNYTMGREIGDQMMPMSKIQTSMSVAADDSARASQLAKDISSDGGYIERILVDTEGNVIEGQHRAEAMRALGHQEMPVTVLQDLTEVTDSLTANGLRQEHSRQVVNDVSDMLNRGDSSADYDVGEGLRDHYNTAEEWLKTRNGEALTPLQRQEAVAGLLGGGAPKKPSMNLKTATAAMDVGPMTPDARIAGNEAIDAANTYNRYQRESNAARKAADPLWETDYSGIRQQRPFSEMDVDMVDTGNLEPRRIIMPEDLEGQVISSITGDKTNTAVTIRGIDGQPLRKELKLDGGESFPRHNSEEGMGWAANDEGQFAPYIRQIEQAREKGQDVNSIYLPMTGGGSDFSTMPASVMMEMLWRNPLSTQNAKLFDDNVRKARPEWLGVNHPEASSQLLGIDNGALRNAFMAEADTSRSAKLGMPSAGEARYAVTAPSLRNTQRGMGGQTVIKLNPEGILTREGVTPHNSYQVQIGGRYGGGLDAEGISYEHLFPDFWKARRSDPSLQVKDDLRSLQINPTFQVATPEWVDNLSIQIEKAKRLREQ